jgi:hypothetical protein
VLKFAFSRQVKTGPILSHKFMADFGGFCVAGLEETSHFTKMKEMIYLKCFRFLFYIALANLSIHEDPELLHKIFQYEKSKISSGTQPA